MKFHYGDVLYFERRPLPLNTDILSQTIINEIHASLSLLGYILNTFLRSTEHEFR